MSEEDIKKLEPIELKSFITENVIKIMQFEDAKKKYTKSIGEIIKEIKIKNKLAMDVLEGKDSVLARKILVEVVSNLNGADQGK